MANVLTAQKRQMFKTTAILTADTVGPSYLLVCTHWMRKCYTSTLILLSPTPKILHYIFHLKYQMAVMNLMMKVSGVVKKSKLKKSIIMVSV